MRYRGKRYHLIQMKVVGIIVHHKRLTEGIALTKVIMIFQVIIGELDSVKL